MEGQFIPRPWARNPHIQTVLGSAKLRLTGINQFINTSKEMVINGASGTRLLGYYSKQTIMQGRGLVTLIHGWEGSSDSTYILSTSRYLYEKGYDIFRLNLRDHGNSHHLNEGLFHGALTEETFQAVHSIASLSHGAPYYIIGFSLGGNFALRIALEHSRSEIPRLRHVFCVSPALDPYKATVSIDTSLPIYRHYFLNKWKRSLKKKQSLFPHRYDFHDILKEKTCIALTEAMMPYYPDFDDYREYFKRYTLLGDSFANLAVPVTVIASKDDPIVPVSDYCDLKKNRYFQLLMQNHGGHCGFLNFLPFECWYERKIDHILTQETSLNDSAGS
ncbi:MAG: alpha/beta fold hydrolase [Deltaproteobacteria bacterium]